MSWKKVDKKEKRHYVSVVSQAIRRSEGSISAIASRLGFSIKGGLTIDQIIAVIEYPEGTKSMDWKEVREVRHLLEERGYFWVPEEEARDGNTIADYR